MTIDLTTPLLLWTSCGALLCLVVIALRFDPELIEAYIGERTMLTAAALVAIAVLLVALFHAGYAPAGSTDPGAGAFAASAR